MRRHNERKIILYSSDRQDGMQISEVLFFYFICEQDYVNFEDVQWPLTRICKILTLLVFIHNLVTIKY